MVPIRSSTQNFLEIEDIKDDLLLLRDGSVSLVLETSAVNFGLLSGEEQEAIIYSFAAFLNSLSFPVQISILSKRMDVSSYLDLISQEEQKQKSSRVRERIRSYYQFVLSLVKENRVLEKRFFIVIPFSSFELGVRGASRSLAQPKKLPLPKEYILQRAKTALFPKRDHLKRQLSRLGLKTNQLNSQQLTELFYEIYNLEVSESQKVPEGVDEPIVQKLGTR